MDRKSLQRRASCMNGTYWPFFGLRITTTRLELRYPDDELAVALADVAAQGVHDPSTMPFTVPWTDAEPLGCKGLWQGDAVCRGHLAVADATTSRRRPRHRAVP
jgi:hypothetical protein